MESYSTQAILSVVDHGFTSKMRAAAESLDRIDAGSQNASSSIMSIAKGIGVFKALSIVGNTLSNSLSSAIDRFDTMNRFPKVMQQIGFSAEASEASIQKLSDGIQGVPTSLDEITASTQKLALLTGDLDKATDASIALNNAFYASAATASDASRGLVQYTQMLSKGTVDIQSWRTLQETMGVALNDLAEAFGYAGSAATTDLYAAIQSGEITFDQLNDKLIELDGGVDGFAERAKTASAGIGTSLTNMEIAVTRGMETVIRSINDALENNGLPGFQGMIEKVTSGIDTAFSVVADGAEVLVGSLNILLPVLGTATTGFVAYKAAMNISDKYSKFRESIVNAADTLNALENATRLTVDATAAQETATVSAGLAERKMAQARTADIEAVRAQSTAKEAAAKAVKLQQEAEKAALDGTRMRRAEEALATAQIKVRRTEEQVAAAQTRLKAAEDRMASASAKVLSAQEKATTASIKARTMAEEAASAAAKGQVNADKLAGAAAKAKEQADRAAASVTKARETAEKRTAEVIRAKVNVEKKMSAVTEAKANVDKASAAAEGLKATAAKKATEAEAAGTAAAEAAAIAGKKSAAASVANAKAEEMEAFAATQSAHAEAMATAATAANAKAASVSNVAIATKTALLGVLSGEYTLVEAGQLAWNAAMAANPIGAAIVAVAALATVLVGVSKALGKLDPESAKAKERLEETISSSKDLVEALESSENAYDENISSIRAAASANEELAGKIGRLMDQESRSIEEKAELQAYVDAMNSAMEGLNLQYDAENDALNMSIGQIDAKVAAYKKQAEAQAAQERLTEILKEQYEIDEKLATIEDERAEIEKEYQDMVTAGPKAMSEYNQAVADLTEQETALNDRKKELTASEEHMTEVMVESQTAQSAAVNASVESQILSMEDLTEAQQSAVESMSSTWQSYADQATNMFDTLSDKSELSVSEMTANLQENQRIIGEWANNIESLAQRGVDEGLLEQLRQAGPESAGYVNAMVQASDAELQALSDAFAEGGETATTAFKTAFQLNDVPQGVMDMVTQTEQSLRAQIEAADFASIGKYIPEGLGTGISENSGQAAEASSSMAEDVNTAAADTMGIHSPSTVFMEYGRNLIEGLAIGIQDSSGRINTAMSNSMSQAGQTAISAMDRTMRGMKKINTSAFSGISTAAKTGMSQMTAAVTSGTAKSNTVMQSGMKAMNVSEQAGLRAMKASMTSGMAAVRQAVDSGMNQSNASVARGAAAMTASLRSLRTSFYNSGYYASVGLAQGINAGAGVAISAAQRLANKVATTMREALQVHSPSRVTMEIGEYAGIGAAVGLMNVLPDVEKASRKVSKVMTPGAISDYANSISAHGKMDGFSFQAESRESTADYDYLIEGLRDAISDLNIQVQAIISARDIGNTSAKYVDRKIGTRTAMKERYGSV